MRIAASIVLIGSLLLVSACKDEKPGEPTTAEMQEAIGANIKADVERTLPQASARAEQSLPGFQGFTAFTKKECVEVTAPSAGYKCGFNMSIKINNAVSTRDYEGFFSRDEAGKVTFKP